jgi:hypothetical protein
MPGIGSRSRCTQLALDKRYLETKQIVQLSVSVTYKDVWRILLKSNSGQWIVDVVNIRVLPVDSISNYLPGPNLRPARLPGHLLKEWDLGESQLPSRNSQQVPSHHSLNSRKKNERSYLKEMQIIDPRPQVPAKVLNINYKLSSYVS